MREARRVLEADVCIAGGGVSAAMVAEKLADERDVRIVVVEAGSHSVPLEERMERRRRSLDYGENPWLRDHVEDQSAEGIMSRAMVVGGLGLHWGGVTPRFTPEDFRVRSLYGIGTDWPIDYETLEPRYQEAEERMGVAGEQGPPELDPRSRPYPMPAVPLSWNLARLQEWTDAAGIPTWSNPVAKNTVPWRGRNVCQRCDTCSICPTGAKYSPDFTWAGLAGRGTVEMVPGTLVRRLEVEERGTRIERALAVPYERPDEPLELRASVFVLAAGYTWSPHLLLLSTSARFPEGLANSSGLVGRYMSGHRSVGAYVELPMRLYPGMYNQHSLVSKAFQRPGALERYVRHDFRVWDSDVGRTPRLRDPDGRLLLGDQVMADWRDRLDRSTARLRSYYDVVPDRESRVVLDPSARNRFGDPLPRLQFRDDPASVELRGWTEERIAALFEELARTGGGRILRRSVDPVQDHPGGGCRMGDEADSSVVDSRGRSHDHENLFVVGAPTLVSGGCNNGTLTFAALALRAAEEIGRAFPSRR